MRENEETAKKIMERLELDSTIIIGNDKKKKNK